MDLKEIKYWEEVYGVDVDSMFKGLQRGDQCYLPWHAMYNYSDIGESCFLLQTDTNLILNSDQHEKRLNCYCNGFA